MTLKLITAILMTMATLTWLASALLLPHAGADAIFRWVLVLLFAAFAVYYWRLYFNAKNAQSETTHHSGT